MSNYSEYIGIDEVARGNLFGPLIFVGSKLKNVKIDLDYVMDSKLTTKSQRNSLYKKIINDVDYVIIETTPQDIDCFGLSHCIHRSLKEIKDYFGNDIKYLYDGNNSFGVDSIETMVKADLYVPTVSASSIIAKSYLDRLMEKYDKRFPKYGLIDNAGYGTKKHIESILEYGYTDLHRKSYKVKKIEEVKSKQLSSILF